MMPGQYPAGLEIPVVVRVEDFAGEQTRRVNGWVTNSGVAAPAFRVLRGVGHGFLPAAAPGPIFYTAFLHSIPSNKTVTIEASTTCLTLVLPMTSTDELDKMFSTLKKERRCPTPR